MYKFYKNLIPPEVASNIYKNLMPVLLGNLEKYNESKNLAINGRGLGYVNFPDTLHIIDDIKKIITRDFGSHYIFTHSYIRMYPHDSILHPHVDRQGLDLTLSVNIYKHDSVKWPLKVSKEQIPASAIHPNMCTGHGHYSYIMFSEYMNNYESFETEPGDGICTTRNHVHWRDFTQLANNQDSFVQCFYHWQLKN